MTDDTAAQVTSGRVPPAEPETAAAFFAARMACQTDVSDVHHLLGSGEPGLVLVDTRSDAAWRQGRIPGAVHLPTDQIPHRAQGMLDPSMPVVTYCWGPGCNGSTRAALLLSRLGYRVREMIGGFEYWVREGFAVETDRGRTHSPVDPLTAPTGTVRCHC
jgi:rhodanese-related sulfurtransferase